MMIKCLQNFNLIFKMGEVRFAEYSVPEFVHKCVAQQQLYSW